jgi:hypothetical protein
VMLSSTLSQMTWQILPPASHVFCVTTAIANGSLPAP